jgi:hypothetical protein
MTDCGLHQDLPDIHLYTQFSNCMRAHPRDVGIGLLAFRTKGYKFPTKDQMVQFHKYHIMYDIDESIRDIVIWLNQQGYTTMGSCAGHSSTSRGFITFKNRLHLHEIWSIITYLTSVGISNITYSYDDFHSVEFDPLMVQYYLYGRGRWRRLDGTKR